MSLTYDERKRLHDEGFTPEQIFAIDQCLRPVAAGLRPKTRAALEAGERLMTMQEVAERLHVSRRTVENLRSDGRLDVVKVGRTGRAVRIRERSVERYVAQQLEQ